MKKFLPYAAALLLLASCSSDNTNKTAAVDSVIPAATDEKTQMSENALHFINDYVNNCNQMNKAVGVLEWVNTSDLASDSLRAIVKKAFEEADKETGLDYDPIFNAQEYPEEGFELESVDEVKSIVVVKGKNNSGYKMNMQMVKENGVWKVGRCGFN